MERGVEEFKMAAPTMKESNGKAVVSFKGEHNTVVNSIRRTIVDDVPTFAVEDVEIVKNESPLYDESVAHRVGLIPLTTDLKTYKIADANKYNDVGTALTEVHMLLKADEAGYVYSGAMSSDDPKIVPADKKIPITKLLEGKKLELNMKAMLGTGREHAKWSPAHSYLKESGKDGVDLIIEPHGQLSAKEIYNTALNILVSKVEELEAQL